MQLRAKPESTLGESPHGGSVSQWSDGVANTEMETVPYQDLRLICIDMLCSPDKRHYLIVIGINLV